MTDNTEPTIDELVEMCFDDLCINNTGNYIRITFGDKSMNVDYEHFLAFRKRIEALISDQVAKDRQQLIQRIKEEVIGKKREPSNSNSSFDLYLYATNEGYNQAIDEVNQILETIMNRSSYDR